MRGFMNSLPLQGLLVMWVICSANGAPYSKYGRTCKDIGCLPRETCVMAYESCSFSQQENVSCGRYPTCKKTTDGQATQQNSGASYNPSNAAPDNTRDMNANVNPPREPINPNIVFGFPSSNNHNNYPQMPPPQIPLDIPRLPDNRQAFPASPNQGGSFYPYVPPYHPELTPPPNVFGPFRNNYVTTTKEPSLIDQFLYNKSPRNSSTINNANLSSSSPSLPTSRPIPSIWNVPTTPTTTTTTTTRRTTTSTTRRSFTTPSPYYNPSNPSYNGGGSYYGNRFGDDSTFGGSSFTRPTTRYTTKRPSSSSSGGLNGFLSGLSNVFGGDVGKFLGAAINSRGGSSSSGGLGGFGSPDTRSSYRGSLFSENTPKPASGINVGPYPVTRYGNASPSSNNNNPSHGNYGWKLQ